MEKRDYYEVLGVSKTASDAEIKSAYKKCAIKYHPDRQAGKSDAEKKEAEEKFKEAAEAYDVLHDPQKRQRYDQFGFAGVGGAGSNYQNMSTDDIFSMFGDVFSDLFGGGGASFGGFSGVSGFGGGSRGGRHVEKGSDLRLKVRVNLNEQRQRGRQEGNMLEVQRHRCHLPNHEHDVRPHADADTV